MTQIAINPTPPPDDRPHKPADDTEEVYFEGSPLLRSEWAMSSSGGWSRWWCSRSRCFKSSTIGHGPGG